jgi:hypothetical protein
MEFSLAAAGPLVSPHVFDVTAAFQKVPLQMLKVQDPRGQFPLEIRHSEDAQAFCID